MRTKTLLLAAAAVAAGIATSQAQVFSVNAVGYVNKTIPNGGFALLANPLTAPTNTIQAMLDGQLPGANGAFTFFVWDTGKKTFLSGSWDPDFGWSGSAVTATINPGGGFFVQAPKGADVNVTFVGEVPTGNLSTTLVPGLQIVASQVPQAGKMQTDLGYNPDDGDTIFKWDQTGQKYAPFSWSTDFQWSPSEPLLDVGEAIFLEKTATAKNLAWTRTFNINQ